MNNPKGNVVEFPASKTLLDPASRLLKARREFAWYHGGGQAGSPSFSVLLYGLIAKADHINRERLRAGFAEYVAVWEEWQHSNNPHEYLSRCKQ